MMRLLLRLYKYHIFVLFNHPDIVGVELGEIQITIKSYANFLDLHQ